MESLIMGAVSWIINKYPVAVTILAFVGVLRLAIKPIMTAIGEIVLITPTEKDNAFLKKIEESKAFKGFLYALDYLASIKIKTEDKKKSE